MARALVAVAVTVAGLAAPPLAAAQQTVLHGTVGPGFTIALRDASGARVTHVDPGTYVLQIDDRSDEHNFHLFGPNGVDVATDVEFVGTATFTITLVDGIYTFRCDPHPVDMRGAFAVGTARLPTRPPPPRRLVATVGPRFLISLRTASGARVRALPAGRYTIVVRDRSRRHNFHLVGRGVNRRTGVRFTGTVRWTVTLAHGARYRFFCDPHARRMRGSFRVT